MSRDIIRTRLTRNGHEVTAVCNGRECLVKAHEEPFDIFILDISMPVKDGLQTLKELKTLPATSRTPTLALSVHSMDRDRRKAIEAGFDEYDTKPLDLPRLLEKINKLLAKTSSQELYQAQFVVISCARGCVKKWGTQIQFQRRRQLFTRVHNETLRVAAMRVCNPDRSPGWNQSLRRSPKLQPALLRLSAMLSQFFIRFRAIALMILRFD